MVASEVCATFKRDRMKLLVSKLCLVLAICRLPAMAQAAKADEDVIFSAETRLVPLSVTVQDHNGHLVTNLPQSAFQVYENGVLQPLKLFKREDVEISLGLIIDNSGSMRDKRKQVAVAALDLVKDSNPHDEVFIVNFNDEAFLDADFTSDTSKMEQALTKIDSRGGTAMRDAIRMSIDHLKAGAKRDKKVLLVVTDGNDNASLINLENLVKEAQNSGVLIYAIGLLTEEERSEAKKAKRSLDALTEATGGEAFYPKDLDEVDRIAHQVAKDLRNQYSVAYSPTNQKLDGSYRQIKVTVNAPGHPVARTRSGYYANATAAVKK
jgi:Ca-activated chloride channel family protein